MLIDNWFLLFIPVCLFLYSVYVDTKQKGCREKKTEYLSNLTEINPGSSVQNLELGIISFPVLPAPLLISAPTTQYKNIPGKNLQTWKI